MGKTWRDMGWVGWNSTPLPKPQRPRQEAAPLSLYLTDGVVFAFPLWGKDKGWQALDYMDGTDGG